MAVSRIDAGRLAGQMVILSPVWAPGDPDQTPSARNDPPATTEVRLYSNLDAAIAPLRSLPCCAAPTFVRLAKSKVDQRGQVAAIFTAVPPAGAAARTITLQRSEEGYERGPKRRVQMIATIAPPGAGFVHGCRANIAKAGPSIIILMYALAVAAVFIMSSAACLPPRPVSGAPAAPPWSSWPLPLRLLATKWMYWLMWVVTAPLTSRPPPSTTCP